MLSQRLSGFRVLLLEDDPRDGDLVTHALERVDPRCTVLRVDGRQAFDSALDSFAPDVILSDDAVADLNALDALHLARARLPGAPFLLVASTCEQATAECLRSGASGFINKSELTHLGSAISTAVRLRAPLRRLSKRQRQVLQMVAAGGSTSEIARRLRLSVKTVETHRTMVMRRTGIHDLAGLVRYAIRVGLVSAALESDSGDALDSGNPR